MLHQIKTIVLRNADTLIEDMFGVAALFTLLIVGLHLPSLV